MYVHFHLRFLAFLLFRRTQAGRHLDGCQIQAGDNQSKVRFHICSKSLRRAGFTACISFWGKPTVERRKLVPLSQSRCSLMVFFTLYGDTCNPVSPNHRAKSSYSCGSSLPWTLLKNIRLSCPMACSTSARERADAMIIPSSSAGMSTRSSSPSWTNWFTRSFILNEPPKSAMR